VVLTRRPTIASTAFSTSAGKTPLKIRCSDEPLDLAGRNQVRSGLVSAGEPEISTT
jgi:hypothetical protein